ncbi:MAG: hypothetical protein ABIJ75_05075 [Actinomycetota bacterium]
MSHETEGPSEREELEGLTREAQNLPTADLDVPCSCGHKHHDHDRQWGTCDVIPCLCDGYQEAF